VSRSNAVPMRQTSTSVHEMDRTKLRSITGSTSTHVRSDEVGLPK